jgi:hypothetical protein
MNSNLDILNFENRKDLKKLKFIETLSFMNSWYDLFYEYEGENELKMLRSCYIFHALNTVLRQNEVILANDKLGKIMSLIINRQGRKRRGLSDKKDDRS